MWWKVMHWDIPNVYSVDTETMKMHEMQVHGAVLCWLQTKPVKSTHLWVYAQTFPPSCSYQVYI